MVSKDDKITICYNHIAKYWPEEYYKKCLEEWRDLQKFILPKDTKNGFKCSCGVVWSDKVFINHIDMICPSCDQSCQPCLSNPINKEHVLLYIHPKYYKYIFEGECKDVLPYLKENCDKYEDRKDLIRDMDTGAEKILENIV